MGVLSIGWLPCALRSKDGSRQPKHPGLASPASLGLVANA
ncbi:hypothetical protein N801_13685 [Knoellia aerolata DSM 18566]|uniref:Uncharacterized protein n=1 Tax=Knoellia aerolata DSM 18566 TaxID=1385519 RepID=A0A0A0K4E3_9MICO|nr:hypothetical protein N801_13685 [Knoellia aerolata DSM 18566]